jgi:dnd system-associated protein 4
MSKGLNWRTLSVYRDSRYEHLISKFASSEYGKKKIFATNKDMMTFCALLGYEKELHQPIEASAKKISISLDTYSNTNDDAYIYLLALAKEPCLDILKTENLNKAIKLFEGYCNAGLKILDEWNMKHSGDPEGFDILFDESFEHLISISE